MRKLGCWMWTKSRLMCGRLNPSVLWSIVLHTSISIAATTSVSPQSMVSLYF